jgi:hypothetical protein
MFWRCRRPRPGQWRRLAREEGIFAGTSSGLNVVAALRLAREVGTGGTVVTIACDSGLKYLDGPLFRRRFRRRREAVSSDSPSTTETTMVMTKPELTAALQNEVRILLHLAGKIDPATLDYRPTAKQRSTIALLRYLTMMGPALLRAAQAGNFDEVAWTAAEKVAEKQDLAQAVAAIKGHHDVYAKLIGGMSDADFRAEIEMFGSKSSRGAFIVNQVLCGCAAYRTQLFLYLKAGGREELSTMNLWAGLDATAAV